MIFSATPKVIIWFWLGIERYEHIKTFAEDEYITFAEGKNIILGVSPIYHILTKSKYIISAEDKGFCRILFIGKWRDIC